ncbi:MAG: peptidoglycan DD-metalloendopeptidase family protein [Phycisphaerales bacterium]
MARHGTLGSWWWIALAGASAVSSGAVEAGEHQSAWRGAVHVEGPVGELDEGIPPEVRERIERELPWRRAVYAEGLTPAHGVRAGAPPLYPFYPIAGVLNGDIIPPAFVDHDPTSGVADYDCNPFCNDGHAGIDTGIRNFDVQAVGVPVFAVEDGVVLFAEDGEPDMNLACIGAGNYVIVDHGGGRESWYFHLANGSVAVNVGDPVVAGEQVGLAASSGCSFGPHLHFESRQDGNVYDPFDGPCNPDPGGWAHQPALVLDNYLIDFGVTNDDLSAAAGFPYAMPTDAQLALSDSGLYFWAQIANLPQMATWRVIIRRPDTSVAVDTLDVDYLNPVLWRDSWTWWMFDVADMHTIPGTWHVEFMLSGQTMVDAPVEVVATPSPAFNRPPEPIGVSFEPAAPAPDDVIRCVVDSAQVLDDLDWDLVRYRYQWYVDGSPVRDVTSAARSDVLERGLAAVGEDVACVVTPSDGKDDGAPVMVAVTVANPCPADVNGDGVLNLDDVNVFAAAFVGGNLVADVDGNGVLNLDDVNVFAASFIAGCP